MAITALTGATADHRLKLVAALAGLSFITPETEADIRSELSNWPNDKELGQYLISRNVASADNINQAYAKVFNLPFVASLGQVDVSVLALIPRATCVEYGLIPYKRSDKTVTIALADPMHIKENQPGVLSGLRKSLDVRFELIMTTNGEFERVLKTYPTQSTPTHPIPAASQQTSPPTVPRPHVPPAPLHQVVAAPAAIVKPPESAKSHFEPTGTIDLVQRKIDPKVLHKVPLELAEKYRFVVFEHTQNLFSIACERPEDPAVLKLWEFLESANKVTLRIYRAGRSSIEAGLDQYEDRPLRIQGNIDLVGKSIAPDLLHKIPYDVAAKHRFVIFKRDKDIYSIASQITDNPLLHKIWRYIGHHNHITVQVYRTDSRSIDAALKLYSPAMAKSVDIIPQHRPFSIGVGSTASTQLKTPPASKEPTVSITAANVSVTEAHPHDDVLQKNVRQSKSSLTTIPASSPQPQPKSATKGLLPTAPGHGVAPLQTHHNSLWERILALFGLRSSNQAIISESVVDPIPVIIVPGENTSGQAPQPVYNVQVAPTTPILNHVAPPILPKTANDAGMIATNTFSDTIPSGTTKPVNAPPEPVHLSSSAPKQAETAIAGPTFVEAQKEPTVQTTAAPLVQQPGQTVSQQVTQQAAAGGHQENEDDLGSLLDKDVNSLEELQQIVKSGFIPKIVAAIVSYAITLHASDVHIEAALSDVRIRYRVDGMLQDVIHIPVEEQAAIVSRIKILSKLKIDETRIPQDGRFDVVFKNRAVDLRVSSMPMVHGEKIVMRILDKTHGIMSLEDLGVVGRAFDTVIEAIKKPYGIVLSTGPTGSGKSTTLYAILNRISVPTVNVITLEDPVEYEITGVNQSQIKPKIGFTFAEGLRSVLRQDPNIIMVGEIRDAETASMATHAALTGHLVLSTLHTNDAAGALPRLINMGIEPFLITSSINVIEAQRLVRKVCTNCKENIELPASVVEEIKKELDKIPESNTKDRARVTPQMKFFHGKGCDRCQNGYRGRIGIYEVMPMSDAIEDLAIHKVAATEIQTQAIKEGMITMKQDGLLKALAGLTTVDEVMRETSV